MASASIPNTPDPEGDLVARLVEEYKILQDKIDKIGAFRFTIKGWSITVIIASSFAGSTTKIGPRWLWGSALVVFLILFFLFEKQQTDLSHRFGQRVLAIEGVLSRLLRNIAKESNSQSVLSSFIALHFVPGIGHHLRAGGRRPREHRRRFWQSYIDADLLFYVIQLLAVVAFVFWSGTAATPDHPDSNVIINNSSPPGPVTTQSPEQPAEKSGGRRAKPAPVGENEKRGKNKKELQSYQ